MGPTSWATVKISAGRPDAWQSPRSSRRRGFAGTDLTRPLRKPLAENSSHL